MSRGKALSGFVVLCLMVGIYGFQAYENLTHQQLTKRAVQVAGNNAQGVPPDLVALFVDSNGNIKDLGQQLINAAGKLEVGEDYTDDNIDKTNCSSWVVHLVGVDASNDHYVGPFEEGKRAEAEFLHHYQDAVDLWKHGNHRGAAFVLGRCLHLIEDMAAVQHVYNEDHSILTRPSRSFIEDLVEANIAGGTDFCYPSWQHDFWADIRAFSTFHDYHHPRVNFEAVRDVTKVYGRPFKSWRYTESLLERAYTPHTYPSFNNMFSPNCDSYSTLPSTILLPFEDSTLLGAKCERREDIFAHPFSCRHDHLGFTSSEGHTLRYDFGMKLSHDQNPTAFDAEFVKSGQPWEDVPFA